MRKPIKILSMLVFPVFLFSAACGSDGKDGASCTVVENTDGSYTVVCDDGTSATFSDGQDGEDGQDGRDGVDGEPGEDGTSCTVEDNGDGTYTISCTDGTEVTFAGGTDGEDGTSCTVEDNGDGTYTISCTDGTEVTFTGGTDGEDGTSCTVVDNGDGTYTMSCTDGTEVTFSDGEDGQPCTVVDNGDGTITISCPDGTEVTFAAAVVPENNACEDGNEITAENTQVIYGDTTGATRNYQGTESGGDTRGPATWYHFSLTEETEVTLLMEGSWDTYLYLLSGDCSDYQQIAYDDDSGGSLNALIVVTLEPGDYIVVATGYSSFSYGPYTLTAEFGDPGPGEETVVFWSFDDENLEPDVGDGEITPGPGLAGYTYFTGNPGSAVSFNGWGEAATEDEDSFLQFEVNLVGYEDIGFSFDGNRSNAGPTQFVVYYSTDGMNFYLIDTPTDIPTANWEHYSFDLSGLPVNDQIVYFRVYGYDASSSLGTWRFDNVTFTGFAIP